MRWYPTKLLLEFSKPERALFADSTSFGTVVSREELRIVVPPAQSRLKRPRTRGYSYLINWSLTVCTLAIAKTTSVAHPKSRIFQSLRYLGENWGLYFRWECSSRRDRAAKKTRTLSRYLLEETISDVFATRYCAVDKDAKFSLRVCGKCKDQIDSSYSTILNV